MLSVNQGIPSNNTEASLRSTAARLMKSTREGNNPNFIANFNQFNQSSSANMHSIWKGIFQNANNNMTTNTITTTNTTGSSTVSNTSDQPATSLHRTHFNLPNGLTNLALTAPLLLPAPLGTKPDPFAVAQGGGQMGFPANGHLSPVDNALLSYSPLALGHLAVPALLPNHGPMSAGHAAGQSEPAAVLTDMGTAGPAKSPTGSSPLASIAKITSALGATSSTVGGAQFLAACTPLLQLAVRQALGDCLSTCGQVSIQGLLEITVSGMHNSPSEGSNGATTILKFNDDTPSNNVPEQMNYSTLDNMCLPTVIKSESVDQIHTEDSGMNADSETRRSSTTSQSSVGSSSRRKLLNPSRCGGAPPCANSMKTTNSVSETQTPFGSVNGHNVHPTAQPPPPPTTTAATPIATVPGEYGNSSAAIAHSNPDSPSADSGVLDLSRAGSLVDSAPITPMKGLSISTEANIPLHIISEITKNYAEQSTIMEAYQKQIETLSQLQTVWSKVIPMGLANMNMFKSEESYPATPINNLASDRLTLNVYQLAQYLRQNQQQQMTPVNLQHNFAQSLFPSASPSPPFGQQWSNGPMPAPKTSATKGIRRQRVSTGGPRVYTSRTNVVRRSTSSRHFSCNQCREGFPSLHTLEEHTVLKHGTYRCHVCKAQFTQRSNLQRHALKHVGFKPFECRVCSKAYYRKDHLMRHMEMGHPGYTPRENITVHLTSSESLEFLNRSSSGAAIPNGPGMSTDIKEAQMDYSISGLDTGIIDDELAEYGEVQLEDLPHEQTGTDSNTVDDNIADDTTVGHEDGCSDTTDQVNVDECHFPESGDPKNSSSHDEMNTNIN